LLKKKAAAPAEIEAMRAEIENEVARAFDFAEISPFPEQQEAFRDLYADAVSSLAE